ILPASVKEELIDKPFNSRKFKLESMMVAALVSQGIFKVHPALEVDALLNQINNMFMTRGTNIRIVSKAEVEALAVAVKLEAAYVVDERTMRLCVENPEGLHGILQSKLHTRVQINEKVVKTVQQYTNVKIIRSAELMMIALEKGLLNKYMVNYKKKDLADAVLWGLKLHGCAISSEEIKELEKLES
ncbi:MAG: hypothetical protein WC595_07025, partial [Candidatus Nanoarchaeia archaeon]